MRKLNEVLVKSGAEVYREIVTAVLHSLMGSIVLIPLVLFTPAPVALMLFPLLYMPLLYGGMYAYHRKWMGEASKIRDVWAGAVKGFVPSAVFGFLITVLILIVWSTWWYYGGKDGFIYLTIAVFQTYFALMAWASQFYTLQLVLQKQMGIFHAMGESVKLFFRHPAYTIGACIQALIFTMPLLVTIVGFAALFGGIAAIYMHKAANNMFQPEAGKNEAAEAMNDGSYRAYGD
ncbi:hypothetical protein [Marinicrinis lubricantis]|uniref:DUF624 domain-containing protein n=1 Tax=Marinicrinis lubricantis TaxID=2086470 RepID=A0ABW1IR51_9BACL